VVFGHSFHEYPDGEHGNSMLVYRMMYSFRMPLFLFVSGFLMVFTNFTGKAKPIDISGFLKGKLKRLLLPFFILTAITYIPRAALSMFADDAIELSLKGLVDAFFYADKMPIPFFWFLQASFLLLVVGYIIFAISIKRFNNIRFGGWIYFLLLLIINTTGVIDLPDFFSLNMVGIFGVYFSMGCLYGMYSEQVNRAIRLNSLYTFLFFAVLWAVLFFRTEHTPAIIFCSTSGIVMCISMAQLLVKYKITVLDTLIGSNYIIFLLSWYMNTFTQQFLHHITNFPWWVYSILSFTCGVAVPCMIYKFMQAHADNRLVKVATICLGQNLKKRI
jgi:hypothetical protein